MSTGDKDQIETMGLDLKRNFTKGQLLITLWGEIQRDERAVEVSRKGQHVIRNYRKEHVGQHTAWQQQKASIILSMVTIRIGGGHPRRVGV